MEIKLRYTILNCKILKLALNYALLIYFHGRDVPALLSNLLHLDVFVLQAISEGG